jgi:hypothetical protein
MMTTADLKALACEDCPTAVTAQVGRALDDSLVMTVVVEHEDTCPWAAANVPAGGVLLRKQGGMVWHRRAGDPDEVPS